MSSLRFKTKERVDVSPPIQISKAEKTDSGKKKLIYADDMNYWRNPIMPSRQGLLYRAAKRAVDILFAVVFLVLGIPWIIVCGLLMKREAPGPFFYKQDRVGKDGKILTVYKLRSMPVDAERKGPQLTPIGGDRRVGPVGKFIRKTKIDELPQFWNVLIGEISVVGPRPERPFFVNQFSKEEPLFNLRHLVKPGLTGLAQVKEVDAFKMRQRLRYDLFYVRKHNFTLDMIILWRTAMY
ncbi:MAG TPA: sugar transferase, partial [Firmicutes bacterium]|nr:sugar transferase [Bacillota bacterium]